MSVDSGMGNYAGDDDLEAIENGTLPGTSNVQKIIGSLRTRIAQDNPVNTDTNINKTERVDLTTPPKAQTPLELLGLGEGFSTPVDYTLPTNLASSFRFADDMPGTAPMMPGMQQNPSAVSTVTPPPTPAGNETSSPSTVTGSFNAIAYVIENGEIKCASCETYYIPRSEAHVKSAHCGAPECHDERQEEDMKGVDGVWTSSKLHRNVEEGDVVDGRVIKTTDEETRLASTDDYLSAFSKTASDSQLYYRGYEDAKSGRPLDEDLAELSDDYFHGYDQFKFYHQMPQQSMPQNLYDIKPNSNNNPRMMQGEVDAGPNQLTDGHSFATHASRTATHASRTATDNLKEANDDPLGFAHQQTQRSLMQKQQRDNLLVNMALMRSQDETNEKVCELCDKLGDDSEHGSHIEHAGVPRERPTFKSPGILHRVVDTTKTLAPALKTVGENIAEEQAKMLPKEIATEVAGGGPEDLVADGVAGLEGVAAIGKGLWRSRKQVGDIAKGVKDLVKPTHASKLPFPTDVIERFFKD